MTEQTKEKLNSFLDKIMYFLLCVSLLTAIVSRNWLVAFWILMAGLWFSTSIGYRKLTKEGMELIQKQQQFLTDIIKAVEDAFKGRENNQTK